VIRQHPQRQQILEARRGELARQIETLGEHPSPQQLAEVGRLADWFDTLGLEQSTVQSIRRRYSQPNFRARVSDRFIRSRVQRQVNEYTDIHDCILGTRIEGTGLVQADVTSALLPSSGGVVMQIVLSGNTLTNTRGYNGPVTIHSVGNTTMHGRQQLLIGIHGIQLLGVSAHCNSHTRINAISAGNRFGRRLIERVAWNRAGQQKPAAEAVASRRAEQRLVRRLSTAARGMADRANHRYASRVKRPLERADVFPDIVRLHSANTEVEVAALQRQSWQLSACQPPKQEARTGDVTLCIHESFVNNSIDTVLGGITISDERLVELLEQNKRDVPEELRITPEKEPWSISFDFANPVRVEFRQERMKIVLRGREFVRNERPLKEIVEIGASYQLGRSEGKAVLLREGPVQVNFVEAGDRTRGLRGTRIVGYRTFIERKFENVFPETIAPRNGGAAANLKALEGMHLSRLRANDGWLTAEWTQGARPVPLLVPTTQQARSSDVQLDRIVSIP
jgi:hypothetical protein